MKISNGVKQFNNETIEEGFTILELLVTMLIIAILSAVLFLGTSKEEARLALQRAALILAQDLRETQELAMGAKEIDCGPRNTNIFGVNFPKSGSDWEKYYILFGDCNDPPNYRRDGSDINIRQTNLAKGVKVLDVSVQGSTPPTLDIAFKPPDPAVYINQTSFATEAEITLCLEVDTTQTKKVKINTAGRIEIE